MLDTETTEKSEKIKSFLKEAFCIDGEVNLHASYDLEINGKPHTSVLYKLIDSQRGEFYVSLHREIKP